MPGGWMPANRTYATVRICNIVRIYAVLQHWDASAEYFNAYALMNAEAIYDYQRSVDNNKRVFLLTRSGFAGLQRYSTATWSGDI